MSEVNRHMRKNVLIIATWSEPLKIRCHVIVMQQRATVEQCARKYRNVWIRRRGRRHEWTTSSSLHRTRTVKLAFVQCEFYTGKQSVIARIKSINRNRDADFRFFNNFWFLVPISEEGIKTFFPLCGHPWKQSTVSPEKQKMPSKEIQVIWQP